MSGEAECDEGKTWNSCRLREVAGTVLVICAARGAWNADLLLEAL